ncbi:ParB/RepB/Spo0J family partition protein [Thiolapillus sp.]|uniref:ParB/RepB/Spo0J family partition protein n=1 Tax=Thiolapillus sp. TaxID=2017437 RepID=UPI003AF989DC
MIKFLYTDQLILSMQRPKGARLPRPTSLMIRLARSIGAVPPIMVRPVKLGKRTDYEILSGEQSWFIAQSAGIETIACHITDINNEQARRALETECDKDSQNPIDYARSIQRLMTEQAGRTNIAAMARTLGISRGALHHKLRLLKLCDGVQSMLINDQLTPLHVRTIVLLEKDEQRLLSKTFINENLSAHDSNRLTRYYKELKPKLSQFNNKLIANTIKAALEKMGDVDASPPESVQQVLVAQEQQNDQDDLLALMDIFRSDRSRTSGHPNTNIAKLEREITERIGYSCVVQGLPSGTGEFSFRYVSHYSKEFLEEILEEYLENSEFSIIDDNQGKDGWFCVIYRTKDEADFLANRFCQK